MSPELKKYIAALHQKSIFLDGVLRLLDVSHDHADYKDLGLCLTSAARELTEDLVEALDSVNLPDSPAAT